MTDLCSPLPCACLGHLTNTATMAHYARGSSLTRGKRPDGLRVKKPLQTLGTKKNTRTMPTPSTFVL